MAWCDDRLLYAGIIFGDEVDCLLYDFHVAMAGKCADLVEDTAGEECPVVSSGFSRINLMDRVCAACNVTFQPAPCFLPFFFFGPVFFREQLHGFQKFLTPFQEFVVSVLIGILCLFIPLEIESAPSCHHRVCAA